MKKSKTIKGLAMTTAFVGLAGYMAGILTAPKSGRQTRKDIAKMKQKGLSEGESQLKQKLVELSQLLDQAKDKGMNLNGKALEEFKLILSKSKDNKDKVKRVLSAIHEGEASDKDLANALEDAKNSINHLKSFFKK